MVKSQDRRIALIDCNSFYCSCEALFEPRLWKVPLVVLSNNDGVVVSHNRAARELGVPRGATFFNIRHLMLSGQLAVRSSNYSLYGDISSRVMVTLQQFSPVVEVYSIDEAFLSLDHVREECVAEYAERIRSVIRQWVGIPVSIGIGGTKTLAKIANRIAKASTDSCTFCLSPSVHPQVLSALPVGDVWGIGSRWQKMLKAAGIDTALKLQEADDWWIRKCMGVVGLRTVLELRGISCLPLEPCPPTRKSLIVSRSFGQAVRSIAELKEAVATFTARAARKLRREHLACSTVSVFVQSSRFKDNPYSASSVARLPLTSNSTSTLLGYTLPLAEQLWQEDVVFSKAGVLCTGLQEEDTVQLNLFHDYVPEKVARSKRLMRAVDTVNGRYGHDSLRFAAASPHRPWQTVVNYRSARYTTCWEELPIVRI